ncbi:hypothetical protein [Qingshengfaniella alkalisoli]|nr:hypothetical protein [Qingshengfaniella alkalisoli]
MNDVLAGPENGDASIPPGTVNAGLAEAAHIWRPSRKRAECDDRDTHP